MLNASKLRGYAIDELEEVEITQAGWDDAQAQKQVTANKENLIQAEMRKLAEDSLRARGEL